MIRWLLSLTLACSHVAADPHPADGRHLIDYEWELLGVVARMHNSSGWDFYDPMTVTNASVDASSLPEDCGVAVGMAGHFYWITGADTSACQVWFPAWVHVARWKMPSVRHAFRTPRGCKVRDEWQWWRDPSVTMYPDHVLSAWTSWQAGYPGAILPRRLYEIECSGDD
jgi:hypothetical protein